MITLFYIMHIPRLVFHISVQYEIAMLVYNTALFSFIHMMKSIQKDFNKMSTYTKLGYKIHNIRITILT
ncbi:hypothetical protein EDF66_107149 [Sphingobacterium sp. JUb20]|nr:hypothetical protein [Sphingobacterium sp. JUb21]TCR05253.1 hypothetical protein EDF66_107149 [Sphingobacterium sp. JUb20]